MTSGIFLCVVDLGMETANFIILSLALGRFTRHYVRLRLINTLSSTNGRGFFRLVLLHANVILGSR